MRLIAIYFAFLLVFASIAEAQSSCPARMNANSCSGKARTVDSLSVRVDRSTDRLLNIDSKYNISVEDARTRYQNSWDNAIYRANSAIDRCKYSYIRQYSNLTCSSYYYSYKGSCEYKEYRIWERYIRCQQSAEDREKRTKNNLERQYLLKLSRLQSRYNTQRTSAVQRLKRDQQRLEEAKNNYEKCLACLEDSSSKA